jgi:hypothetical protein
MSVYTDGGGAGWDALRRDGALRRGYLLRLTLSLSAEADGKPKSH